MELYKFRELGNENSLKRIKSILEKGFYCSSFFDFNDVNEGVFPNSKNTSNVSLSEKQQYKICSLSKSEAMTSQLMWGHYANSGMGVAIQIQIEQANIEEADLYEVNYDGTLSKYDTVKNILVNKSKEWEYEKEVRYLKRTDSKFYSQKISKIYFGTPFKGLSNYEDVKRNHPKLKEYLNLKNELKEFCNQLNVKCEEYDFNHITKTI